MHQKIRASFTLQHHDRVVALIDRAVEQQTMSITNDAENVVAYLHAEGVIDGKTRLIYRDTEGRWDELMHDGHGHFIDFRPIGESTVEAALAKLG